MELAFLLAWRRGFTLNYTLWPTGVIKCNLDARFFWSLHFRCTPVFNLGVHLRSYWRISGVSFTWNAPWAGGGALYFLCVQHAMFSRRYRKCFQFRIGYCFEEHIDDTWDGQEISGLTVAFNSYEQQSKAGRSHGKSEVSMYNCLAVLSKTLLQLKHNNNNSNTVF